MWHVIQYGLFQTLWERKIMHALSLGAMLCHVELFYCSMLLMGTAANSILRYQHRRRVTNMQFIHKTCELACAENEDLHKPSCLKQGKLFCSAIPGGSWAGKTQWSSLPLLTIQEVQTVPLGSTDSALSSDPGNAALSAMPGSVAELGMFPRNTWATFWWAKLLLSNQAAVSGGVL